ncbi:MAG: hypothetical protein ACOCQ1_01030 [Halanaerobiaceae bacterium]
MKKMLVIVLGFLLIGSGMIVYSNSIAAYEPEIESITGNYTYIFWDPENFNDLLQKNNQHFRDFSSNVETYYQDLILDYIDGQNNDFLTVELSGSDISQKEYKLASEINSGQGFSLGAVFNPLSRLRDYQPVVQFDFITTGSSSDFEMTDASGQIIEEDEDTGEEYTADFDISGGMDSEVEYNLKGISVPGQLALFDKINLSVGPLFYWGTGEITHNNKYNFSTSNVDDQLADRVEDIPEVFLIETEETLNFKPTSGWKIGANYRYDFGENVFLFVGGQYRSLEMDVEVTNRKLREQTDQDIESYLEDSIYNEFTEEFSEDLSGTELILGLSFNF